MQDQMQLKDKFKMQLECGHPNKNEGEWCELCGKQVPRSGESNTTVVLGQTTDRSILDE